MGKGVKNYFRGFMSKSCKAHWNTLSSRWHKPVWQQVPLPSDCPRAFSFSCALHASAFPHNSGSCSVHRSTPRTTSSVNQLVDFFDVFSSCLVIWKLSVQWRSFHEASVFIRQSFHKAGVEEEVFFTDVFTRHFSFYTIHCFIRLTNAYPSISCCARWNC